MAKLYFKYGVMGSSKTAELLMTKYRYEEAGMKVAVLKPSIDTRDGDKTIKSRIGLSCEAEWFENFEFSTNPDCDIILIDEAQFLSEREVVQIARFVEFSNIPVICYGLRTDFLGRMFEGSKTLFEMADSLTEIKTVCWCGTKALFNARVSDGIMITDGDQICLGTDNYVPLCRKHYLLKMPYNS